MDADTVTPPLNLNDLVAEYEQRKEETVKKIMQKKNMGDYYFILGLPTDCSAEDVRRAFLKLSLLVHPDKNKSPDANEAFKHVLDACQRLKKLKLSDEEEEDVDEEKPDSPSDSDDDLDEDKSDSDDDLDKEKPHFHSGNRPSPNGENPESGQETPGGWGRQFCVMCGKAKDGILVCRPYCSLICVREFLDSRRANNLQ